MNSKTQSKWKLQWEGSTCSSVKGPRKKSRERKLKKKKKMAGKKKWWRGWSEKGKAFMLHLAHKWLQPWKEQERSDKVKTQQPGDVAHPAPGIHLEKPSFQRDKWLTRALQHHLQHIATCSTEHPQTHESRGSDPWTWWKEIQPRRRKERPLHEHRSIQG